MTTIKSHPSTLELEGRDETAADPVGKRHFHAVWLLSKGLEIDEVAELLSLSTRWLAQFHKLKSVHDQRGWDALVAIEWSSQRTASCRRRAFGTTASGSGQGSRPRAFKKNCSAPSLRKSATIRTRPTRSGSAGMVRITSPSPMASGSSISRRTAPNCSRLSTCGRSSMSPSSTSTSRPWTIWIGLLPSAAWRSPHRPK